MTEQISFPPLLDLSPSELQAHKQHLVSEIAQQPEPRRLSLPGLPSFRLRFALPAIAAVGAAVAAVIFTGTLGGGATGTLGGVTTAGGGPPHPVTVSGDAPGGPIPLSQALSSASKSFGVPIILPDTPLLNASDAGAAASEQWLPSPKPGVKEPVSQLTVEFPSPYVSITYAPTALTDQGKTYPNALDQYRAEIAQATDPAEYKIVSLSDGTPALIGTGTNGNSIEFRLGKLSITIWAPNNNGGPTTVDASSLQALAQSMVDQAATANP